MSSFDEQPVERKYTIAANITLEQRIEANVMKSALGINSDTALLKKALASLSHAIPDFLKEFLNAADKSDPVDGRDEGDFDDAEGGGDVGVDSEAGEVEGETSQASGSVQPDPWGPSDEASALRRE